MMCLLQIHFSTLVLTAFSVLLSASHSCATFSCNSLRTLFLLDNSHDHRPHGIILPVAVSYQHRIFAPAYLLRLQANSIRSDLLVCAGSQIFAYVLLNCWMQVYFMLAASK